MSRRGFPTRHNYGLGLWQNHVERILAGWLHELEVPVYYGVERVPALTSQCDLEHARVFPRTFCYQNVTLEEMAM